MPPRTIVVNPATQSNALSFQLPAGFSLSVESVFAQLDNTAGGDTTGLLEVADSSGAVIARKRQSEVVSSGSNPGSATWALGLDDEAGGGATAQAWCSVAALAASTVPVGVSTAGLFNLVTNDAAAFTLVGSPRVLRFNKRGVYIILGQYDLTTTVLSGPVANPWTTFVQGGLASSSIPTFGGSDTVSGVQLSPAVQVWQRTWLGVATVDAGHVGGNFHWNWQNASGVALFGGAFATVLRVADA